MSIFQDLYKISSDLPKSERKAADYFLQYPYDIQRFTCDSIANTCGTSRNAIIRLCQKLGFKGYSDFKSAVLNDDDFKKGNITPSSSAIHQLSISTKKDALGIYCEGFEQMRALLESNHLSKIAEQILFARQVVTMGLEHSSFSANQLAFRLNRSGISSFSIAETTLMSSQTETIEAGNIVVIFSISGSNFYSQIIESLHQKRVKVILITMTPNSPIAKLADYVVTLPFLSHSPSKYLLDDAPTFFIFIEMLIEAIQKRKDI